MEFDTEDQVFLFVVVVVIVIIDVVIDDVVVGIPNKSKVYS